MVKQVTLFRSESGGVYESKEDAELADDLNYIEGVLREHVDRDGEIFFAPLMKTIRGDNGRFYQAVERVARSTRSVEAVLHPIARL